MIESGTGGASVKTSSTRRLETTEISCKAAPSSWLEPRRVALSETDGAGQSLDRRMRELASSVALIGDASPEHLAILVRWHGSSWRDGEWIGFESFDKLPYRKLVNAVGRVAALQNSVRV